MVYPVIGGIAVSLLLVFVFRLFLVFFGVV